MRKSFCRSAAVVAATAVVAVLPVSPEPASSRLDGRVFAVATDPAWSPDGKKIAFVASTVPGYDAPRTLYVMNADGSHVRAVTAPEVGAGWPSWSPDGRRIAFHGRVGGDPSSQGIYVIDAGGGGLRMVVGHGSDPAWGPGGTKIAFEWNDSIFTVSPDGSGLRAIAVPVPSDQYCDDYVEPTWSPDGERVAFANTVVGGECGYRVFIGSTRGYGASVKVLFEGWYGEPDWSRDGRRLALVRNDYTAAYLTIGVWDLRKGSLVSILGRGWHPRWAPNGRKIVLVRGKDPDYGGRSQIYVMNADGSNVTQLTRSS